jgi:Zn-dependent peptidase ImmA (M78 family)
MTSPNPQIIKDLMDRAGVTDSDVATDASIDRVELQEFLSGESELTKGALKRLAAYFAVDTYLFYRSSSIPGLEEEVDFRLSKPAPKLPVGALAHGIREGRELLSLSEAGDFVRVKDLTTHSESQIERLALECRKSLRISDDAQVGPEVTSAKFFKYLRFVVEDAGPSVITRSIEDADVKGFALSEKKRSLICLNSFAQNKASRNFTLAHELAHFVAREPGVSNTYKLRNKLERACNKFATHFLMPKHLVGYVLEEPSNFKRWSNNYIRIKAARLKVSQEALTIRLEELDLVPSGFSKTWKAQFKGRPYPAEIPDKGFGATSNRDEGLYKTARFGYRVAKNVLRHKLDEPGNEFELYSKLRVRPEHLDAYLSYASEGMDSPETGDDD